MENSRVRWWKSYINIEGNSLATFFSGLTSVSLIKVIFDGSKPRTLKQNLIDVNMRRTIPITLFLVILLDLFK